MYDLSILLPSIRTNNWFDLIESIKRSCTKFSWELVIVGPEDNYEARKDHPNISFIKDYGTPNRCQQIALINSSGKICLPHADDCFFEEGSLDSCLDLCKDNELVVANYSEGGNTAVEDFLINKCYPAANYIDDSWIMFNAGFCPRELMIELGGYDCGYLVTCVSHADFSCRLQKLGKKITINNIRLSCCQHEPNVTGTHSPIHYGQLLHDIPRYQFKFAQPFNTHIDINNWKKSPAVWKERFK